MTDIALMRRIKGACTQTWNLGARVAGIVVLGMLTACGGGGGGSAGGGSIVRGDDTTPVSASNWLVTAQNVPVSVAVPTGSRTIVRIEITSAPTHGTAVVRSDRTIYYTPHRDYIGNDSFVYRITDNTGDITVMTMDIRINCANCAPGVTLALSWDASPDTVLGYLVYFGTSAGATNEVVSHLSVVQGSLDPGSPSVTLNTSSDLGVTGGNLCFRIQAYNSAGFSGLSSPACVSV